ncbi:MAG: 50S ribosomal protein L16 [Candidatus Neomarinimicrobiota bacterium]
MLEPGKVKWRKHHRGRRKGLATRGNHVVYGSYGLKTTEPGWITARQIEAARVAIIRRIRKHGRMWIRIFPDKPVTKKPAEVRMGKGKGPPDHWVAVVKPGRVLFEIEGVDRDLAAEAFRIAGFKLPVRTRLTERRESGS